MDTELINFPKYIHGIFNIFVFQFFCWQGWLGWTIRRSRKLGLAPVPKNIRRHRRIGPIIVLLGIVGIVGGFIVASHQLFVVHHHIIHLSLALILALLIILTFLSSKKIKSIRSPWRSNHAMLGLCLLFLYCIQVAAGLIILL